MPDGVWVRVHPADGDPPFNSQEWMRERDYEIPETPAPFKTVKGPEG